MSEKSLFIQWNELILGQNTINVCPSNLDIANTH